MLDELFHSPEKEHMETSDPGVFAAALPGMDDSSALDLAYLVRQAFGQGWTARRLRNALTASVDPAAVRNPAAAYTRRLARLGPPPPPRNSKTPTAIPPPCPDHEVIPGAPNDLNVRLREDDHGRVYRCPDCHPFAPNYRGAAA